MRPCLFITLILLSFCTYGQVCTGSLGDPTAVINFGTGTGIGPSLSINSTSLTYNGNDCPPDGTYVIINKTNNCFNASWHSLLEDHTPGDTNGYMMLVNAKNTPDIFYTFPVSNLCPNTTYEFSSYILNVLKASATCSPITRPQLTFRVETENGDLINSYDTGLIYESNNPEWKKYGFFFKSPPNVTTVVLKLINNTSGGSCGNDLALDDITFRPCGPTIVAGSSANGNSQTVFNLCEDASANYNFEASVSQGYQDPAYQWQADFNDGNGWVDIPNSNNSQLNVNISNATIKGYQYRMAAAEKENIQSQQCRVFSNPIKIEVSPKFTIDAGNPIFILEGGQALMNPVAPDGLTYEWTPATYLDNPNIKQPVIKALETITYTLTVTDPATCCTASDEVTVTVDADLKVTDSFSPNGDGVNDGWAIQGLLGNTDTDIFVYNRNGQLVYQSKGYPKEWDGKLSSKDLPLGMYYYIIDTHSLARPVYKGSLLIIR